VAYRRITASAFVLALAIASGATAAAGARTLSGMDAVKVLYQRGRYADAKMGCYVVLWDEINHPEALFYLARSLEKLRDTDQAAVFYTLLSRVLEESPKSKASPRAASRKAVCQKALDALDGKHRAASKRYAETAAGKKFTSPGDADDLWMSQVKCDLRCLHGLYAWKLVGGRKDMKPDWIHNTHGAMHRSGAKYMQDVHGRRGVLFCIPSKKSKRLSSVAWEGPVKGKFLRIGTRAYGFPYILNVVVGETQIFSRKVGRDSWTDVKIPLETEGGEGKPIFLELVVPENQRWMEGLFFDYIDFFED
jgi:hypothetical protein